MAIDNPTATESERETFDELMYRFMSAANRLRLAFDHMEHSESLHLDAEDKIAFFVLQEAKEDLEKLRKDFRAWEDTHEHTPKAPKAVQS